MVEVFDVVARVGVSPTALEDEAVGSLRVERRRQ